MADSDSGGKSVRSDPQGVCLYNHTDLAIAEQDSFEQGSCTALQCLDRLKLDLELEQYCTSMY